MFEPYGNGFCRDVVFFSDIRRGERFVRTLSGTEYLKTTAYSGTDEDGNEVFLELDDVVFADPPPQDAI